MLNWQIKKIARICFDAGKGDMPDFKFNETFNNAKYQVEIEYAEFIKNKKFNNHKKRDGV